MLSGIVHKWVPAFFGALALFFAAGPAHAGFKGRVVTTYSDGAYQGVAGCNEYVFDTFANFQACFNNRAVGSLPWTTHTIGSTARQNTYVDTATGCIQASDYHNSIGTFAEGLVGVQLVWDMGGLSGGAYNLKFANNSVRWRASKPADPNIHGRRLWADSQCSTPWFDPGGYGAQYSASTLFYITYEEAPGGGNEPPGEAEDDVCELPAHWGQFMKPKQVKTAPFKPTHQQTFVIAYQTSVAQPAFYTDGGTDADPTPPGTLFRHRIAPGNSCVFRRDTRSPRYKLNGQDWFGYSIRWMGTNEGPSADDPYVPAVIVVTGSSKKSRPLVKYGTRFVGGKASVQAPAAAAFAEQTAEPCRLCELLGDVEVEVRQQNPNVTYHHPAPNELYRDNPGCATIPDARCAFKAGAQAADSLTKPEELIRLSNDGQTIVRNDPKVYPDTIYPKAMVDAGTAPNTGTPEAPANADEQPGDAESTEAFGDLRKCLEDEECVASSKTMASYLEAVGVDGDKDTSAEGVASSIFDKAMANGRCSSETNKNGFCSLVGALAGLAHRPVPAGDFIWWSGTIKTAAGEQQHQASIPRGIIDFVKLILQLGTALACIGIVLRGRPV